MSDLLTPDFETYPTEPPVVRADNTERWVEVGWADGSTARFNHVWLRDNCPCPLCVHHVTKEQTFELISVPHNLVAKLARVGDAGEL